MRPTGLAAAILFLGLASTAHAQYGGAGPSYPPAPPGAPTIDVRPPMDRQPSSPGGRMNNGSTGNATSGAAAGPDTGAALRSATPRDSTVGSDPSSPNSR
jgi:hypothetical protein